MLYSYNEYFTINEETGRVHTDKRLLPIAAKHKTGWGIFSALTSKQLATLWYIASASRKLPFG